jgi:hypothetical protein
MKRKLSCASLLFLIISTAYAASEIESLPLHMMLAGMKEAAPPQVVENYLILSAKGPYRYVAVAFQSEGFTQIHPFEKNKQGVFLYALPVPLKRTEPIVYRLIIDGVWTSDPLNPLHAFGKAGIEVSFVDVPYLSDERFGLYRILRDDGHTARFLFKGEAGMYVTVAGTFNNWDPFIYPMEEIAPGTYELEVSLPAGKQYYAFFYDGEGHTDPFNQDKATSKDGQIVSVLTVRPNADN